MSARRPDVPSQLRQSRAKALPAGTAESDEFDEWAPVWKEETRNRKLDQGIGHALCTAAAKPLVLR